MAKMDNEIKKEFVETLERELTIKTVCAKLGLSRQSIYRWMRDDKLFAKAVKEAIRTAVVDLNDECENRVVYHAS